MDTTKFPFRMNIRIDCSVSSKSFPMQSLFVATYVLRFVGMFRLDFHELPIHII